MTEVCVLAIKDYDKPCVCNQATPWSATPCGCGGLGYDVHWTNTLVKPISEHDVHFEKSHDLLVATEKFLPLADLTRSEAEPRRSPVSRFRQMFGWGD